MCPGLANSARTARFHFALSKSVIRPECVAASPGCWLERGPFMVAAFMGGLRFTDFGLLWVDQPRLSVRQRTPMACSPTTRQTLGLLWLQSHKATMQCENVSIPKPSAAPASQPPKPPTESAVLLLQRVAHGRPRKQTPAMRVLKTVLRHLDKRLDTPSADQPAAFLSAGAGLRFDVAGSRP